MEIAGREAVLEIGSGGSAGIRAWRPMPGKEGRFGKLAAYDVRTGELLWKSRLGTAGMGFRSATTWTASNTWRSPPPGAAGAPGGSRPS